MRTLFAAVIGAAATLSAVSATAQQDQNWSAAATQDLQAIHDALRDNSPEVYMDQDSAQFRAWLDAGLAQAQKQPLGKVNNVAAYADALKYYTVGFRDANIALDPNWEERPASFAASYPGFSTAWRGGAYVVAYDDPNFKNLPPVGATLISCDRVAAEDIAKQRLDRYEGDLTTESGRFESAPYLLWDRANTMLPPLPQKCDFNVGGRKRTFPITETFSKTEAREAAVNAAAPHPTGLGIESFDGGYWISLHSLSERQSWTPLLNQIDQNIAAIRAAPVVVIDLRGADGGSVRSGFRVLSRLWGAPFVTVSNPPATKIAYRTSKANQDFYRNVAARLQADPMTAMGAAQWSQLADQLAAAAAQNQPILQRDENAIRAAAESPAAVAPELPKEGAAPVAGETPPPPPPPAAAPAGPPVNQMKGRVIVLTDYWCSGACLYVMDTLTRMPNVQQAGTQTSADSIYIGQSSIRLPSGNAGIMFGDKAWLDRPRKTNVPYAPAAGLVYTGNLADEAAVKAWVGQVAGH
ncbi:MAG TPA: hypothetical protein VG407_15055 [Caulobacteraceae bacterium]|jgi:hypothetical protein|nr:hypothetical protein [Caulobacteraceae bacterium]